MLAFRAQGDIRLRASSALSTALVAVVATLVALSAAVLVLRVNSSRRWSRCSAASSYAARISATC
ncbi:hypothetical protein LLE79_00005 [Staphylococcus epidermidis]|nr:hypothetical protein [Staphylococcus epidermidis]